MLDVGAVYREHFDYVFTNLRRLGVPDAALEDACHDVFVVVHRRARSYDHRCAVRTWLYGVVRRVAADVRRSGGRHRRRLEAARSVAAPAVVMDDAIADRRLVQDFLDALDEGKREVFILVELEEMTANEVAATLRINPNTAAARLRAARRVFAERIAAEGDHELRLLAAARTLERAPSETRTRVWAGLAPLVVPAAKASVLVGLGWAAAIVVATTVIVGATSSPERAPIAVRHLEIEPPAEPIAAAVEIPPAPVVAAATIVAPPSVLAPSPPPLLVPAMPVQRAPVPREEKEPTSPPVQPTHSDADLRAETELAGRVLRETDPARILELVDEYRRTFGAGFYADRLSARRIEALCRTDERTLAQTEHAILAKRQPALAERALTKCDADHEPTPPRPSSG